MTSSGKTCQRWDTQTPHKHIYGRLAAHENYCRNPLGQKQRPFCFTTDKSAPWEYCSIPVCSRFTDSPQLHLHFYRQMKNRQYVPIKKINIFYKDIFVVMYFPKEKRLLLLALDKTLWYTFWTYLYEKI